MIKMALIIILNKLVQLLIIVVVLCVKVLLLKVIGLITLIQNKNKLMWMQYPGFHHLKILQLLQLRQRSQGKIKPIFFDLNLMMFIIIHKNK